MEKRLQTKIIKWLKEQGAYVIKTRAAPGVPVGCPDIIFLYRDEWGAIEVKASPQAKFQAGQEATIEHLKTMSDFVYVVSPVNWGEVAADLEDLFF